MNVNSGYSIDEPQSSDEEVGSSTVPALGATYEETFMRQVNNLDETRCRKPPDWFDESNIASLTSDEEEPRNVKEALKGEHSKKWKEALDAAYSSLRKNETWDLVFST